MLVLRRKIGQSLTIGEDIEVVVLSINGNQVRLGAQAPKSIRIDRKEMQQRRLEAMIAEQQALLATSDG